MCDSVHRRACLSACWDTTPTPRAEPPREQTPQEQTRADTPQSRSPQDQPPHQEQTPLLGTRHLAPDQPPPRTRHSLVQRMLGDTVNARAVCILLECNLVVKVNVSSDFQQRIRNFHRSKLLFTEIGVKRRFLTPCSSNEYCFFPFSIGQDHQ